MKIMWRKIKMMICLGMLTVMFCGAECKASGLQDVNAERLEQAYGMDENGNIFELDGEAGIVEGVQEPEAKKNRDAEIYVVNFNTKGSDEITEYVEYGTNASGYTNGYYGADAALILTKEIIMAYGISVCD